MRESKEAGDCHVIAPPDRVDADVLVHGPCQSFSRRLKHLARQGGPDLQLDGQLFDAPKEPYEASKPGEVEFAITKRRHPDDDRERENEPLRLCVGRVDC